MRELVATLDRELAEIEMLVGQARTEAARHEQKRAVFQGKLAAPGPGSNLWSSRRATARWWC